MELAKITTRGRTTIPKRIREAAGLHESDVLAFTCDSICGPGKRNRSPQACYDPADRSGEKT